MTECVWLPTGYVTGSYYFLEDRSLRLFAGLGRSVRTPTSVERYLQSPSPNFHGNPELDPTLNSEADLGVEWNRGRYSILTKGFYSDLRDYIYQRGKFTAASHQTWTNIEAHQWGLDGRALAR